MAGRQVLDITQLMANNFAGYMADNANFRQCGQQRRPLVPPGARGDL